ncbi:hypothetical protein ACVWXM_002971 [Bradyrhizobium sp. GM7.3]
MGRLVLLGELTGREDVQQDAAHDQRRHEQQAERQKQLCTEGQPLPH